MTTRDEELHAMEPMLKLDAESGPAPEISQQEAAVLVRGALNAALGEQGNVVAMAPGRPRRFVASLTAAAVVFSVSAAAAAVYMWKTELSPGNDDRVQESPAPVSPPEVMEEPAEAQEVLPTVHLDEPLEGPTVEAPAPRTRSVLPAPELLARANQLRAERRWRDAERAYRAVHRHHSGTPESYSAMVAAASLQLEHLGNPREALRLYRQALSARPTGPLAAEARYGIAMAHGKLGNLDAERRALLDFLSKHPSSLRRARAESRLHELGQQ